MILELKNFSRLPNAFALAIALLQTSLATVHSAEPAAKPTPNAASTSSPTNPAAQTTPALTPAAQALLKAQRDWQKSMATKPNPAVGCFEADYPEPNWKSVPCAEASTAPQMIASRFVTRDAAHPATVGNSADYAAQATGIVSSMTGFFPTVSGVTSLTPGSDPTGKFKSASNFALQLNTNLFSTNAFSCGAISGCQGWVQFVYSNTGNVYLEYSLINYGSNNCPTNWRSYLIPGSTTKVCYFNTPKTPVPVQAVSSLANLTLTAAANANANDTVTIAVSPTKAYSKSYPDSTLSLADGWNGAEFNLVGDTNSTQTNFNPSTATLTVELEINSGTGSTDPVCDSAAYSGYGQSFIGWTGETNNLILARDCVASGDAIIFQETDGPLITNITPATGPATGSPIIITGNGLLAATHVGVTASDSPPPSDMGFHADSDTQITTSTPACSPLGCGQGSFGEPITVTTLTSSANSPVGYIPVATITNVTPTSGSVGTKVTVTGNGFYHYVPETPFLFNGVPALDVICSPSRNIECTMKAPPGPSGMVDIRVWGSPIRDTDKFTYADGPTIASINPTSGTATGGTKITLTGTNFVPNMVATFNPGSVASTTTTADCISATTCTVGSPRSNGATQVHIIIGANFPGAVYSVPTSADLFRYTTPMPVPYGALVPDNGDPAGESPVTLELYNLVAGAGTIVDFDFKGSATPASNISCSQNPPPNQADSRCTFITPPLSPPGPGPTAIPVSVNVAGKILAVGDFTYETKKKKPPVDPCEECRLSGGLCRLQNGKAVCQCQKSSPTGLCE